MTTPDIDAAYEAALSYLRRHVDIGTSGRWLLTNGDVRGLAAAVGAVGRAQAAADIERAGSILCDCDDADSPPTNPTTQAPMDHHCDCQAVGAAATMLGAYSTTVHAKQCVHGTEFDEFYVPEGQPVADGETR